MRIPSQIKFEDLSQVLIQITHLCTNFKFNSFEFSEIILKILNNFI